MSDQIPDQGKNSFFDVLKERLTSPISGGFIIIWLVHNWDYCLIVFTRDYATPRKIELLNGRVNWWDNFWWPVLMTALYVVIMPFLHQVYENYTLYRKSLIERAKANYDQLLADERALGVSAFECSASLININEKLKSKVESVELLNKAIIAKNFDEHTPEEIQRELSAIKAVLNQMTEKHSRVARGYENEFIAMEALEMNVLNFETDLKSKINKSILGVYKFLKWMKV